MQNEIAASLQISARQVAAWLKFRRDRSQKVGADILSVSLWDNEQNSIAYIGHDQKTQGQIPIEDLLSPVHGTK